MNVRSNPETERFPIPVRTVRTGGGDAAEVQAPVHAPHALQGFLRTRLVHPEHASSQAAGLGAKKRALYGCHGPG